MTYNEALAADFQFQLDQFFERLDRLKDSHDATDAQMLELLGLRAQDLEDQYRYWTEEGES